MQQTINGQVRKMVCGSDEKNLTVEVQIDSSKFKRGDLVKVTIDKL